MSINTVSWAPSVRPGNNGMDNSATKIAPVRAMMTQIMAMVMDFGSSLMLLIPIKRTRI